MMYSLQCVNAVFVYDRDVRNVCVWLHTCVTVTVSDALVGYPCRRDKSWRKYNNSAFRHGFIIY